MICGNCEYIIRQNLLTCPRCGKVLLGGVIFVTGISGTGVREYLTQVIKVAELHSHNVILHDIGLLMREHSEIHHLDVLWEKILDADARSLRLLRALTINEVTNRFNNSPEFLHIIDLHLSFRWKKYLTKGFEPHILEPFMPYAKLFVNVVDDLSSVQERLKLTSWGERKILELLIWRDEELLLTDFFADICGLERSYAIAVKEPPTELEKIIFHPEIRKVYLSFPITKLNDPKASTEIRDFRDKIREFLVVFDPHAIKDYDETFTRPEMEAIREEVGHTTEERDYRFIDQADAVVVYYPKDVDSKGVDAEMNYARRTGKPIYKYSPEGVQDHGPFAVPPSHYSNNPDEFIDLLRKDLNPLPIGYSHK